MKLKVFLTGALLFSVVSCGIKGLPLPPESEKTIQQQKIETEKNAPNPPTMMDPPASPTTTPKKKSY